MKRNRHMPGRYNSVRITTSDGTSTGEVFDRWEGDTDVGPTLGSCVLTHVNGHVPTAANTLASAMAWILIHYGSGYVGDKDDTEESEMAKYELCVRFVKEWEALSEAQEVVLDDANNPI